MYIFQPDRYLLERQIQDVASYVKGRTLDVGAGGVDRYSAGFSTTEYIRLDTTPAVGIDIVGSIYEVPLEDASLDSIICTQVFEHLDRPFDAIRELLRLLRPGGYAILTVPQINELHEEPHDYFRYTNFGLESLCTNAGFTVVRIDQRGGYHAVIAQTRIRYWIDRYALHTRPFIGRVAGKLIKMYGMLKLAQDARATSIAARKHAIGWCIVIQK